MINTLKRIINFNTDDWQHVLWLFRNMIKQYALGNIHEAGESWIWIKMHCSYDSKLIKRRKT